MSYAQHPYMPKFGPYEAPRTRSRWLAVVIIVAVLLVACAGAFLFVAIRATQEARALAPWPGPDVAAEDVATVDLRHLGLQVSGTRDAREIYGTDAPFTDAAVVDYDLAGTPTAWVAALHYARAEDAAGSFSGLQSWAKANCAFSTNANLGAAGVIYCNWSDGHNRILWQDNWVLDITCGPGDQAAMAELASQIRDAAAAQWHGKGSGVTR